MAGECPVCDLDSQAVAAALVVRGTAPGPSGPARDPPPASIETAEKRIVTL
jgi:hypothetical protein